MADYGSGHRRKNEMGNSRKQSQERKKEFLKIFSEEFTIADTCRRANISKSLYYYWRDTDKEFIRMMAVVRENVADDLIAEAWRRACEGVEQEIYFRDKVIGREKKYSDDLLIYLLNKLRAGKYRDLRPFEEENQPKVIVNIIPPKNRAEEIADYCI
jgi:hypothetical protein